MGKIINWLVVDLPLWKMMEFVSWDHEIPNWMEEWKVIIHSCSKPPISVNSCYFIFWEWIWISIITSQFMSQPPTSHYIPNHQWYSPQNHASAWLIPKWSSHGFRGFTLWWFDAAGHGPGALADPGAKQNPIIQTMVTMAGWWLTYPCEKWWSESQLGWLFHSQLNGKIIQMFQTTNQPPFIVDLWRLNCPTFDCWLSSIWKTRRRMARERRGAESSILQDNILKMYDGRREE